MLVGNNSNKDYITLLYFSDYLEDKMDGSRWPGVDIEDQDETEAGQEVDAFNFSKTYHPASIERETTENVVFALPKYL